MTRFIIVISIFVVIASPMYAQQQHAESAENDKVYDYADSVNLKLLAKDTMKTSPLRIAFGTVGEKSVQIIYSSPGVRNRIIWGGVVPYNEVWVTGAHYATKMYIDQPMKIGNKVIQPGQYGIFSIPASNDWTFIVNTDYTQHLADNYDEKKDVVRVKLNPEVISQPIQRLQYGIVPIDKSKGEIIMEWEKVRLRVPFEFVN